MFLIKASAGLILFYLVYWLFLRKETFYIANRWFLMAALFSSLLLPILPVQYLVFVEPENNTSVLKSISDSFQNIPVISESESTTASFNWQQTVMLIYLTVAAVFLLRLFTQTFHLIQLMIKYRIKSLDGVRVVENKKYGLPFSFFNVIFINTKFHKQDELPEILAHEKVHIREYHWFDLLLIELLTVIFWFNPFIWFFERSIKQNHEYLADKGVVSEGHNVSRYQAILVNQLMGMQIIGVTNNLNFALNTNRLKMMTKKKTPRIIGLKFVWALPAIALLLFAFAEPSYQVKANETENSISAVQKGEKGFIINGKVVQENGKPLPGAAVMIKGSAIGTVVDSNGKFSITDPNPKAGQTQGFYSDLVISYVGYETSFRTISSVDEKLSIDISNIKLKEGVVYIDTDKFIKGELPPPPKPVLEKEVKDVPPPQPVSQEGEKEVFYIVEDMPAFPGGSRALSKYIQNLTEKYDLKGKAKIGFTVNAKGKVSDIKIVENKNPKIGKAASEIIGTLPTWKPGSQRGKNVPVKFLITVEFQ